VFCVLCSGIGRVTAICNLQSAICNLRRLAIVLALVFYCIATLPYLANFPLVGQDEPWIAAPAAKLADQGIFGDDLFTGYYRMEQHNYNFPPLFPLTEALAFVLLGVGVWQARLVAVLYGAATLLLTYALGRQLYGGAVGVLAAWMLVGLRLALEPQASGVPLLDLARIARYDIAVPPLVLATLLCFVRAEAAADRRQETGDRRQETGDRRLTLVSALGSRVSGLRSRVSGLGYLATGALVGLAILAHLYGGFVLALIGALLLWRHGLGIWRAPAPYLIALGWGVALLPWALYIARDLPAYRGQMLPEQARFQLWNPAFYLQSLLSEPQRYSRFLRLDGRVMVWPRLGIWLALLGLPLSVIVSMLRVLRRCRLEIGDWRLERAPISNLQSPISNYQLPITNADRLTLLALPIMALLLALLINLKFYNYIVLLLPFIALDLALLAVVLWRWAGAWRMWGRAARLALGMTWALALAEGIAGVYWGLHSAAAASPYAAYTDRVAAALPPGARLLALHQFWFGLYSRNVYRSAALAFYFSDPRFYQPRPLPMDQALERIGPEYILVDRFMAPELHMELPPEAIDDDQRRRFRLYMARHCAQPVAQIADASYGDLTIYRLCP
jgi:4-amino-4-deoxy-L-arabinose transferase-like glycosyltransferase